MIKTQKESLHRSQIEVSTADNKQSAIVSKPQELNALLRKGISWTLSMDLIGGIFNFIAQIWFARMLGVEIIAEYALIVIAFEISFLPVNFGFNLSIIRHHGDKSIYNASLALIILQTSAIILICGGVMFFYYIITPKRAIRLLVPGCILVLSRIVTLFSNLVYAPLEVDMEYKFLSSTRFAASFIGLATGVALVLGRGGIYALVVRDLIVALTLFLFVCNRVRPNFTPDFSRTALTPVFRFSLGVWGLNVLERGARRIDYVIVGAILGKSSLGIYFQVRGLIEGFLAFLIRPIQTVLYSYYCQLSIPKEIFRKTVQYGSLFGLAFALLSVGFLVPLSKPLILVVLGKEWLAGGALLPGLAFYACSILWFENLKVIVMSENLHHFAIIGRVAQIATLVILTIPMTQHWGFSGAGAAMGISAMMLTTVSVMIYLRELRRKTELV